MVKVHLLNFATPEFYKSQKKLNDSAKKFGITSIFSYNFEDIKKTKFYQENKKLLDLKKGPGFYSWKPYIIYDTMKKIKNGDLLIYCDSGIDIIKDPALFINLCKKYKRFIFQNPGLAKAWVKSDCFVLMKCNNERYYDAHMVVAGITFWIKNKENMKILKEYYEYGKDSRIITTHANVCGVPNRPEFIQHVYDQSILSLLVEKYKIKLFDPEKLHSGDYFPIHRMRDRNFFQKIVFKIKMITPDEFKKKIKWFVHHYIIK